MRASKGQVGRSEEDGPEEEQDRAIQGTWWPSDREDTPTEGTVTVFGDGAVCLDTFDDVWDLVSPEKEDRIDLRTLFGRTAHGRPMALLGVRFVGGERDLPGTRGRLRFVAERFILGAEVRSENEVRLTRVATSFRGLREWLDGHTRDTTTPLPLVRDESTEEWVRCLTADVDGVEVTAMVSRQPSHVSRFRTVYDTSASLAFERTGGLTLAEWRAQWIAPLRDMVLFGGREQTIVLSLWGWRGDPHDEVHVYSPPEVALEPADHTTYHQRDLLPAGIWDEDGFPELLSAWRSLHGRLGAVGAAFFELLNLADLAPLTRLLRLSACAEGYHQALFDESPFADEEYKSMVAAMLDALPEDRDIRSHFRARLAFANSQSQRQRIRWLIERAATVDERLQGRAAEITQRLVGWRNEQTHLAEEISTPPVDDVVLLNAVLTYVLEANILLDLGIGENVGYCLAHGHVWDDPVSALLSES